MNREFHRPRRGAQALATGILLLAAVLGALTAMSIGRLYPLGPELHAETIYEPPRPLVEVRPGPDLVGGIDMVALVARPDWFVLDWEDSCGAPRPQALPNAVRISDLGWFREAHVEELRAHMEHQGEVIYWRRTDEVEAQQNRVFCARAALASLMLIPILAFYTRRRRELIAAWSAQCGALGGTIWIVGVSGTLYLPSILAAIVAGLSAGIAVLLWLRGPQTKSMRVVARTLPLVLPIVPVGWWVLSTWTPWAYHLIPSVVAAMACGILAASLGRLAGSR